MEYALEVLKKELEEEVGAKGHAEWWFNQEPVSKEYTEYLFRSIGNHTARILSLESAIKKLEG